jgi:hypothetical protein
MIAMMLLRRTLCQNMLLKKLPGFSSHLKSKTTLDAREVVKQLTLRCLFLL